jgi:hypothetical protein
MTAASKESYRRGIPGDFAKRHRGGAQQSGTDADGLCYRLGVSKRLRLSVGDGKGTGQEKMKKPIENARTPVPDDVLAAPILSS